MKKTTYVSVRGRLRDDVCHVPQRSPSGFLSAPPVSSTVSIREKSVRMVVACFSTEIGGECSRGTHLITLLDAGRHKHPLRAGGGMLAQLENGQNRHRQAPLEKGGDLGHVCLCFDSRNKRIHSKIARDDASCLFREGKAVGLAW